MALKYFLAFLLSVFFAGQAQAANDFTAWFAGFEAQARAQGISAQTLLKTKPYISFEPSVIRLDQRQPEKKITFAAYLKRTLPSSRVAQARRLYHKHFHELREAQRRTGIPAHVIVALWGIESSFGAVTGGYDVLSSLATLAYEGRRSAFFTAELLHALHIVQDNKIPPSALQGSWAGAMGQCQFMPSTYRRYAVDGDGDGRIDIWSSKADVFLSIASYLKAEGWDPTLKWGRPVKLTRTLPPSVVGLKVKKKMRAWSHLGVRTATGKALPTYDVNVSLVQPDGPKGKAYLVTDNYRALMRWNKSTYFATTVGLFSDQIH
ncbi:MAG: lytic transglycosylase domain-containing protein [Bdellovibrionales bacterium]